MGRNEVWKGIWQKKYDPILDATPHVRDGYDLLTPEQLGRFFGFFLDKLGIDASDDVLDVGCGAGALLQHLPECRRVCGVDYSENAIQLIRQKFKGDYRVAEASKLPFRDGEFSVVICFGVFLYFNSLEYARSAIREILRVTRPDGRILIGEVNDLAKKEVADRIRQDQASKRKADYVSRDTVDHLYYPKDFFEKAASEQGWKVTLFDEDVPELDFYVTGRYRYSLVMKKR